MVQQAQRSQRLPLLLTPVNCGCGYRWHHGPRGLPSKKARPHKMGTGFYLKYRAVFTANQ